MKMLDLIRKHGWEIMPILSNLGGDVLSNANVFFVDANATNALDAADEKHGESWEEPYATVDYAIGRCTANQGDFILVAPGHTENKAVAGTAITCDIAGVTIIGLGKGTKRPSTALSGNTGAIAFTISAADVTIINWYIDATGIDAVAKSIDVKGDYCHLKDIDILMADGTGQSVIGINIGTANNDADHCVVENCQLLAPDAGAASGIKVAKVEQNVKILGCRIAGDFSDACIHNPTGNVATNLLIADCYLENTQTGDHSIELVSACTGVLIRNLYVNDMALPTGVDPGSCKSFECYHCHAIDKSGILAPAADS